MREKDIVSLEMFDRLLNTYEVLGSYRLVCRVLGEVEKGDSFSRWIDNYSPLVSEKINDVLETLTEREVRVISIYYGLKEDGRSLESTGEELGYTRQRISQIKLKAERKLRHPTRMKKLEQVLLPVFPDIKPIEQPDNSLDLLSNLLLGDRLPLAVISYDSGDMIVPANSKITKTHLVSLERCAARSSRPFEVIYKTFQGIVRDVIDLELSVRAANCLRDANIITVIELVQKSESELLEHSGFGKKSVDELTQVLLDMGLSFQMDEIRC